MLFSGHPLCPVSSFRKYINKIYATCDDLWQRPMDFYTDDYDCWYTNQPLGLREEYTGKYDENYMYPG